jgi:Deacetylases, including yeast histone deacetylase and acetoin utilization protein
MFERDPELFYASTHQMPLYPGTGSVGETGCGNICNAPLPPNAGSAEFRAAMSRRVLPALVAFAPDMLLISAGFDAHRADPLANLRLEEADLCLGDGRASGSCGPALRRPGCIHAGRRVRLGRARRQRRRPCRTADGRLRLAINRCKRIEWPTSKNRQLKP